MWSLCFCVVVAQCPEGALRDGHRPEGHLRGIGLGLLYSGSAWVWSAVFVTTMPLLPPLVADGVSPVGAVLALAMASILVDINPLGITGGLILGAAEPSVRPRLFRQLLTYGIVSVVIAPLLAWLAFGWW